MAHTANMGNTLQDLSTYCAAGFPTCTFSKQQCGNLPECLRCLAALSTGDGIGAVHQCPGTTTSALYLDNAVMTCSHSDALVCMYWGQRCAANDNCKDCLAVMGHAQGAFAAAADWSTPPCQRAMLDTYAATYVQAMTYACPGVSSCRRAVANCVRTQSECILCLTGPVPPGQSAFCSLLLPQFSIDIVCQPCPNSVHTITVLVLITTVIGGASAIVCVAVVATIVAHGRDRASMWHRIVVGLMLSNAVYSTANTIPLNALHTGIVDCGRLAMSFDAIRFGRALWFCGKYGLVSFELFILGASIRAFLRGASATIPRWAEAAMHMACWTCAFVAFAVFYSLCSGINTRGYDANTENEAYTLTTTQTSTTISTTTLHPLLLLQNFSTDAPSTTPFSATCSWRGTVLSGWLLCCGWSFD